MTINTGWTAEELVREFIRDIEAAHGEGAGELAKDWPDLHATYEAAKATFPAPTEAEARLAATRAACPYRLENPTRCRLAPYCPCAGDAA